MRTDLLPATCLQRRQILASLGAGPEPSVDFAWRLRGPLDRAALGRTLESLVARHEALRTALRITGNEVQQLISGCVTLTVEYADAHDRRTIRRILRARATERFDAGVAPLARVTLLRLGAADHMLVWTLHHAICDGWSLRVLRDDFRRAYAAELAGLRPEWPGPPIGPGDYAAWERDHLDAGAQAYWRAHLPDPIPVRTLPRVGTHPRGAAHVEDGVALEPVSPAVVRALGSASRDVSATLSMALTAAVAVLAAPYARGGLVAVGVTEANRRRPEMRHLVGCCVDFIPLYPHVSDDSTFTGLVAQVRDQLRAGRAHRLPICRIGDQNWQHSPTWFDVLVNFTPADPSEQALRGSSSTPSVEQAFGPVSHRYAARYNWSGWRTLGPVLRQQAGGGLTGTLLFNRRVVSTDVAHRLAGRFDRILRAVAIRPGQPLRSLSG